MTKRTRTHVNTGAALALAAAWGAAVLGIPSLNAFAGGGNGDDRRLISRTLDAGGVERHYAIHRPAGIPANADTLLVLHGSGGDIARIRRFTGERFERLADELGFQVIYAQGYEGNWNGCRAAAPFSANRLDVDDVGFLQAILERESVGDGRRMVFGFSGGGHMALRLALETPESISGITVVGANLPKPDNDDCSPATHGALPSLLLINGTEDPINPYDGGTVVMPEMLGGAKLGAVRSSHETARYFAARNDHGMDPREFQGGERDGDGDTGVLWSVWASTGRPAVALATIRGGGHTIPQAGVHFPDLAGPHSADLDTPLTVWRFMKGGESGLGEGLALDGG